MAPGAGTSTAMPISDCASGSRWLLGDWTPGRWATTPLLLGLWSTASGSGRFGAGLAGPARGAARLGCLPEGHLPQVVVGHEADENAVLVVVPGYAWDHGDVL